MRLVRISALAAGAVWFLWFANQMGSRTESLLFFRRVILRIGGLVAFALVLAGCKPPKFDQMIVCPAFEARGVAIYLYGDSYVVLFPDKTHVAVDRTECVVAAEHGLAPATGKRNEHAD